MHNIFVFKAANDMRDRIGLANVGKELIAKTFTLRCARHQAGNINKFDNRRHDLFRFDDNRQRGEARIGHFDNADVGLDGAEGIVLRRNASLGQRIEQGGFTDVGQTDDAAFQRHDE